MVYDWLVRSVIGLELNALLDLSLGAPPGSETECRLRASRPLPRSGDRGGRQVAGAVAGVYR